MFIFDRVITGFDAALRAVAAVPNAARSSPATHVPESTLSDVERKHTHLTISKTPNRASLLRSFPA
jgi:hypothetical protein